MLFLYYKFVIFIMSDTKRLECKNKVRDHNKQDRRRDTWGWNSETFQQFPYMPRLGKEHNSETWTTQQESTRPNFAACLCNGTYGCTGTLHKKKKKYLKELLIIMNELSDFGKIDLKKIKFKFWDYLNSQTCSLGCLGGSCMIKIKSTPLFFLIWWVFGFI